MNIDLIATTVLIIITFFSIITVTRLDRITKKYEKLKINADHVFVISRIIFFGDKNIFHIETYVGFERNDAIVHFQKKLFDIYPNYIIISDMDIRHLKVS